MKNSHNHLLLLGVFQPYLCIAKLLDELYTLYLFLILKKYLQILEGISIKILDLNKLYEHFVYIG